MAALPSLSEAHVNALFDVLFERAPLGMVLVSKSGQIVRANVSFARMLGYSPSELMGAQVESVTWPEDLEDTRRVLAQVAERPEFIRTSKRYRTREGQAVFAEVTVLMPRQGSGMAALALIEDVSERRRMEAAVARSAQRFELLARASNDLVYEWDIVTGAIGWNDVLQRAYGHADLPETRTLAFWEKHIHPEDAPRVREELQDALERREMWSMEYRFARADGTYASVLDRGTVVQDGSGRPVSSTGVMVDVTELKAAQTQLRHAERLASMGTLSAGVAHEINNPLSWTLNNLAVVREALNQGAVAGADLERARQALSDALEGAERVARIVRDLKTFARPDEEKRAPLSLERVLEAVLSLAHNELRHRARVVRDYRPVPAVIGNESRLGQVFLNLIVNAAQSMPEGAADRNELRVALRVSEEGWVEASVSDTGSGISPEAAARIFEPFFTTRPIGEGTGLGLSICHGIVKAHGGEIRVEPRPGGGTTFRVSFPAHAAPAPLEAPVLDAPPTPVPAGRRRARILVLDDEPLIARALKRALEHHEVQAATSGAEVLERVRQGDRWELILCDLMMPDQSGMDFFHELCGLAPEVCASVVFMTGGAFTPRAASFFATVKNPRLEKPFDARAVDRLLETMQGGPKR